MLLVPMVAFLLAALEQREQATGGSSEWCCGSDVAYMLAPKEMRKLIWRSSISREPHVQLPSGVPQSHFTPRLHDSSSCATSSGAATVKSLVLATSGTVVINHAKGSSSSAYSELPCAAARRRAPSCQNASEASSEKVRVRNFCECNACNGK